VKTRGELRDMKTAIEELKKSFVNMKKLGMKPKDWMIGYFCLIFHTDD
jgi:hypothetical protein